MALTLTPLELAQQYLSQSAYVEHPGRLLLQENGARPTPAELRVAFEEKAALDFPELDPLDPPATGAEQRTKPSYD